MSVESYPDLEVWRLGVEIARVSYVSTRTFPREEAFGMTAQIRRAACSIPANIAEGYGRETTQEFIRGLRIANGSLKELETHVEVASQVGLLVPEHLTEMNELCDREGRMLRALIRKLAEKTT